MGDGFLGAGDLYLDRRDSSGNLTGLRLVGTGKFELNPEAEVKEQLGKGRANFGQVVNAATLPGKTGVAITLTEVNKDNLALIFLGSVATAAQGSGSVADEAVVAHLARHSELAYESISTVVVTDETDATTYDVDVDYSVNARLGMIEILEGGDISEGDVLHVSYDYAVVSRDKITAGAAPEIRARMVLDGINYSNEKDVKVVVDIARLKPSSAVDFLADDFLELEIDGVCEVVGSAAPFEVFTYN